MCCRGSLAVLSAMVLASRSPLELATRPIRRRCYRSTDGQSCTISSPYLMMVDAHHVPSTPAILNSRRSFSPALEGDSNFSSGSPRAFGGRQPLPRLLQAMRRRKSLQYLRRQDDQLHRSDVLPSVRFWRRAHRPNEFVPTRLMSECLKGTIDDACARHTGTLRSTYLEGIMQGHYKESCTISQLSSMAAYAHATPFFTGSSGSWRSYGSANRDFRPISKESKIFRSMYAVHSLPPFPARLNFLAILHTIITLAPRPRH